MTEEDCGGGQGLSWAVEPRRERERKHGNSPNKISTILLGITRLNHQTNHQISKLCQVFQILYVKELGIIHTQNETINMYQIIYCNMKHWEEDNLLAIIITGTRLPKTHSKSVLYWLN
jgi:diphthamide synthase subunit DPH2